MSECHCCKAESASHWCGVCELLLPTITGRRSIQVQSQKAVQSLREELGCPDTRASRIWSRIRTRAYDMNLRIGDGAVGWAFRPEPVDERHWVAGRPPAWTLSDEDIDFLSGNELVDMGQIRRLARGGLLPDGSYLNWNNGEFFLDGSPIKIPFRSLKKLLEAGRYDNEVNWKLLLRSIDLAVMRYRRGTLRDGSIAEPMTHPVHLMMGMDKGNFRGMDKRVMDQFRGMHRKSVEQTSWMGRWSSYDKKRARRAQEYEMEVPVTLVIKGGRLQLRVRRNSGWRRIELGSHPAVWATVVTWALSPPTHEDYRRLMCLTQSLFADNDLPLVSEKDRRGIGFLLGIVNSNDRVNIARRERSLHVTGSSGLGYLVTPGRGNHNTRFVVTPVTGKYDQIPGDGFHNYGRMRGRMAMERRFICIVERPELRRLVIGDAIGSVVLALLDDLKSQSRIATLRHHIATHSPGQAPPHPDVREMDMADNLRDALANNRIAERVRRCTESFPRLWSALLRMPLGERVTFTAMGNGPNIRLDGCETEFSTRNMADRQIVYRILEASGWTRDGEEEELRRVQRIYIRTGTGERDLGPEVEVIARMLEGRLTVNGRIRILPEPLWHHFERRNPGIGALLPGTDQLIR